MFFEWESMVREWTIAAGLIAHAKPEASGDQLEVVVLCALGPSDRFLVRSRLALPSILGKRLLRPWSDACNNCLILRHEDSEVVHEIETSAAMYRPRW